MARKPTRTKPTKPVIQADTGGPKPVSYTLREAAELTGKSRGTIRRYLDEGGRPGRFPNAFQDGEGVWRIPVADLGAAGLSLKGRFQGTDLDDLPTLAVLRAENAVLRDQVATLKAETDFLRGLVNDLRAVALPAKASPWRGLFRRNRAENA